MTVWIDVNNNLYDNRQQIKCNNETPYNRKKGKKNIWTMKKNENGKEEIKQQKWRKIKHELQFAAIAIDYGKANKKTSDKGENVIFFWIFLEGNSGTFQQEEVKEL